MGCQCEPEQGITRDERLKSERWLNDALQKCAQAGAVAAGSRRPADAESFASAARTLAETIETLRRA